MTLQDLLKPQRSNLQTQKAPVDLETQRAKTAQLIAANKAIAAKILKDTLAKLESAEPTSRSVERKIWI